MNLKLYLLLLLAFSFQHMNAKPPKVITETVNVKDFLEYYESKNQKSEEYLLELANAYMISAILNEVSILKTYGNQNFIGKLQPYFGYNHRTIKWYKFDQIKNKKMGKKALIQYSLYLKKNPGNISARLLFAWANEVLGDKKTAIAQYREVITNAWKTEENKEYYKGNYAEYIFKTYEAGERLIRLLDKKVDHKEVQNLNNKIELILKRGKKRSTFK